LEPGKGKTSKKAKAEPSREEMHAVVVDILKEVDFNTVSSTFVQHHIDWFVKVLLCHFKCTVFLMMQATLSDILRQLGMIHFH
jgi:protein DEK